MRISPETMWDRVSGGAGGNATAGALGAGGVSNNEGGSRLTEYLVVIASP